MGPDLKLEGKLWAEGYRYVVGLDEVGRGPLAGPVVAGAVLLTDPIQLVQGVTDSKKLTEKKRDLLAKQIWESGALCAVGECSALEIDKYGIADAVRRAMVKAFISIEKTLNHKVDYIIADGAKIRPFAGYKSTFEDKGDFKHYSIAAASIIAKVYRDNLMTELSKQFPDYHFDKHKGYGTSVHLAALRELGPCSIHRRSFRPVSDFDVK